MGTLRTVGLAIGAVAVTALMVLAIYWEGGAGQGSLPGRIGQSVANTRGASAAEASTLAQGTPSVAGSATGATSRTIVVVGTGTATATPDVAFVTVGVQTRGQTAKDAQDQNNTTMAAVIAAVKALKIADKDIQTSGISLSPVIQQENQVSGYQATNQVTVRVVDVNQAGPVLDAAVAAGANTAGSVRFGLKDEAAANRQALDAAAKDAQDKANAIAKSLGVQISAVDSAVEVSGGGPVPVGVADRALASAAPATPVETGELSVTARVQVTYTY